MTAFDWQSAPAGDVNHQYSPSRWATKPIAEHLADYARLSAPWVGEQLLRPGQPLLVYIHGGYWQALSARDSLFMAPDASGLGVSVHAVDYLLAPAASVEQIVEECITDIERILSVARAPRVVLAGSSAGGHLATMCTRSPRLHGRIDLAVMLSGVFDLRPLVRTPTNDALGLTSTRAASLSPQLLGVDTFAASAMVAVGQHESPEFVRQSADFAAHLSSHGVPTTSVVVPGRDHFDLPYDVLRAGTVVGDHVLAHLLG